MSIELRNSGWQQRSLRRAQWVAATLLLLIGSALVGLLARVAWIQRHASGEAFMQLDRQHDAIQRIMPNRGTLRFSDGTVVAASVRMYNLYADPSFIMDPGGELAALKEKLENVKDALGGVEGKERAKLETQIAQLQAQVENNQDKIDMARKVLAEALSPALERPAEEIQGLLQANISYPNGAPRRFLWLAREVDDAFKAKFDAQRQKLRNEASDINKSLKEIKNKDAREAARNKALVMAHALDGVGFVESVHRQYPLGPMAGSVIGFANQYKGVDGLEAQLDPLLTGRWGEVTALKDAQRRTLMLQQKQYEPAEHGCNVWLTIDTMIQHIVEEELASACVEFKAESGCAIILDPANGRILAMANYPTFDPSQFQAAVPETRKNKCVVDPYEPGSIFKPFIAAVAIEKGIVRPHDVIFCHNGRWADPTGRIVTDVHGGYGAITVEDILVKSSNIGMAQIGWKMGIPTLYDAVTRFGFGQRTGVELPGDSKGIIRPYDKWNKGTLTSVSFGYEAAATPLQLVRAFATFANGGYLVTPQVMYALELEAGKTVQWQDVAGPPVQKQIISSQTAEIMRNMLEGVFTRGTARRAQSRLYRLFGKTGTAHLAVRGAGHYASDEYNSSFLAGGPMSSPKLVVVVTLHKPDKSLGHFGGTVAAPAASHMLERSLQYLQVPADQPSEPARSGSLAGF